MKTRGDVRFGLVLGTALSVYELTFSNIYFWEYDRVIGVVRHEPIMYG